MIGRKGMGFIGLKTTRRERKIQSMIESKGKERRERKIKAC